MRKRRASKAIGPNQIRDGAYNEQQKDSANPAYGCLLTPVANTLPRSVLRHSLIIGVDRIRCILPQGANITGPRGNGADRQPDIGYRGLDEMTCDHQHDHDLEQQAVFEQDLQAIIDRAYDKEKVCELVSALQKGLAGVLACDVVENGGGKERIRGIAQGIADYIVEVHAQLAEGAKEGAGRAR